MPQTLYDIYCGPAPDAASLAWRWNLDPVLLAALAVLAFVLLRNGNRRTFAVLGLVVLAVAFVSPLCALASALFSARVLHHVLLVAAAAPFLALALGRPAWLARAPQVAFAAHTLLFWLWHSPAAYAFALSSHAAYWLMQLSLLVSAVWIWAAALSPRTPTGNACALLFGTMLQMGMLAALLTFSREPLYDAHLTTTAAFGLTPLEDQQLAGVLMWVPAAGPYLLAVLWRIRAILAERSLDRLPP
ncbi:cytochrome c oxidase assembly protein [Shinella sp.]|uniref:cytochrome c oxidase assembly protein n=1 Tax=Shinella sp. TaxID=1870904 RepID=UPI0029B254AF|nr:cytochrome c oxidase assembly protein [Shinella sp.]MDX3975028.1 cytochrome c oxidase assembly protein [Shinella sp.]